MSGVREVAYSIADAALKPKSKAAKKRKKRAGGSQAAAPGGWKKVDLEEIQIEGFEDGCALELEELTDYQLEKTEGGGQILVSKYVLSLWHRLVTEGSRTNEQVVALCSGNGKDAANEESSKPAKKKRRKSKKKSADQESGGDDAVEASAAAEDDKLVAEADADADADSAPSVENAKVSAAESEKKAKTSKKNKRAGSDEPKEPAVNSKVRLPKWDKFKLHPVLLQSLHLSGFASPTPIQQKTIFPALVDNRDIVGAAPTGSGKTLAFGLPILSQLLRERDAPGYTKDCKALILTPTRELALQIHQHLEKMVRHREIGIVTLVGGMAVQKQQRMLGYSPEIVIGTPGRLWDLIDSNHAHFKNLAESLRFLVIDEADRMLQTGSYPEVEHIFDVLRSNSKRAAPELVNVSDDEDEDEGGEGDAEGDDDDDDEEDIDSSAFSTGAKVMMLDDVMKMHQNKKDGEDDDDQEDGDDEEDDAAAQPEPVRHTRQTFLFSATLTIPEGGRFQKGTARKHHHALTVLESVMKRVGLRGKPAVVDLSIDENANDNKSEEETRKLRKQQANVALSLPAGLELCQHEVTDSTRDSFLYYFLTQYPGRTIVFLNAIHQVRRLAGLLNLLQLPVFALHAEMQQRQRLKKLDGFRAHEKGILIATDVAARGLDIPSVDYVVHYHIARSTEVFVHRSGRTARANKDGLSISLVAPADAKYHSQICKMLQRPTGLSEFPFDHRYLPPIDERVRLAKSINDDENESGKIKAEENWFAQMAKEADLDLDDNLLFELNAKKRNKGGNTKNNDGRNGPEAVAAKRTQLSRMLSQPLRPVGSARKFRQIHQELGAQLTGDGEYRKRDANDDLATKSKKAYKRFRRR